MNLVERIIGPFFDQANSLFEAFLDIALTFYGVGFVVVRTLLRILS